MITALPEDVLRHVLDMMCRTTHPIRILCLARVDRALRDTVDVHTRGCRVLLSKTAWLRTRPRRRDGQGRRLGWESDGSACKSLGRVHVTDHQAMLVCPSKTPKTSRL